MKKEKKAKGRPSMQQDGHPEHQMPPPQHDGAMLGTDFSPSNGASQDNTDYTQ